MRLTAIITPLLNHNAEQKLNEHYRRLGQDVAEIRKSFESIAQDFHSTVSYKHQLEFVQHVHEYVTMRTWQTPALTSE